MKKWIKKKKLLVAMYVMGGMIVFGFLMSLLPFRNPVVGATTADYHP